MKPNLKQEWEEFDWVNHYSPETAFKKTPPLSILQVPSDETPYDRKLRMLIPLSQACQACSMCELGLKPASKNNVEYDPHVFSNMKPTRIMVVGQNPGWSEVRKNTPFIGESGNNFNVEIAKHGFQRDDFYICNTVRCFTSNNERPSPKNIERCEPFLRMEINLIKPRLLVALGAVAFEQLCPGLQFTSSLGTLVKSKYSIKVFPIYHPSPLNLDAGGNRKAFCEQISLLCSLMVAMKEKYGDC